jgi:hypothetical protein
MRRRVAYTRAGVALTQRLSGAGCDGRSRKRSGGTKTACQEPGALPHECLAGARQRPAAALSGSNPKASGSAGGYLLHFRVVDLGVELASAPLPEALADTEAASRKKAHDAGCWIQVQE